MVCAGLILSWGSAAMAQPLPLSEVLPQLLGSSIVLDAAQIPDQPNHEAHFQPGAGQEQTPGQFNRALLTLLSTHPVGTPSGGFTYTFDPNLGSFRRTSESFGPTFAERALTIGRGRVSVGFGHQRATYDTFEGLNLRQREVTFYVPHIDCCSRGGGRVSQPDESLLTPAFEGDLIRAELALDLATNASVVFVNYGVLDRLDVGVAIPFLHVTMEASVLATIERLATSAEPETHAFSGPNPDSKLFRASGSASGLGDIVVRSKYVLWPVQGGGVAAALDLRVPTGDETNLLGTGGVQARAYGVASLTRGRFSPHVNAGYTFSSRGALPGVERLQDEINTALGFDLAVTPRATLAVDIVGRTLLEVGRLQESDHVFEYAVSGAGTGGGGGGGSGGAGGGRPVEERLSVVKRELQLTPGNLQLYFGSASVRFSPWRSLLVTAGLLFPLTDAGLRDRVTPVIGIDYGF